MGLIRRFTNSPGRTVLLTVALTIILGTLLLFLPAAQTRPISLIDCFFTATSATCVTGVLTVPFESFSIFGKCIILGLIQIGGIGLLTLWLFLVALFFNLGMSTKYMIGKILELTTFKNTHQMLFFIIGTTIIVECIGALGIYLLIKDHYSLWNGLFHAFFHSVSSFCSAGLSSFGSENLVPSSHNLPFLGITSVLILLGGIGFATLHELFLFISHRWNRKRFQFSLSTKVVVHMTAFLITIATILLLFLEGPSHFPTSPWWETLSNMLFNAISYRSVGFTTIDLDTMQIASIFLIMMYSFIGSSPLSTGSGIKVTTFAIFLATIKAVINGRMDVDIKNRRIPQDQLFKAMSVLSVSLVWITASTFLLVLSESNSSFISVFFEAVSSFTNLGLATSITPTLTIAGKLIIIVNMFMGRVGILTLMLALRVTPERKEFHYPEERIMMS
jgi:trk system potassium uptake protein TrkH